MTKASDTADAETVWVERDALIDRIPRWLTMTILFVIAVGIWDFVTRMGWVSPIILPSPKETLDDLIFVGRNLITGDYMLGALWTTTLTVSANKYYANGKGAETKAKLDEPIEVGLFTARPGLGAFSAKDVIVMGRERLHDGSQRITLKSKAQPAFAGVDPYNFYVDRNSDDNVMAVTAG